MSVIRTFHPLFLSCQENFFHKKCWSSGSSICLAISYSCRDVSRLLSFPLSVPHDATDVPKQHPQPQQEHSSLSKSCGIEEFEACLLLIKSVTDSEELAFASTMQELSFACRYRPSPSTPLLFPLRGKMLLFSCQKIFFPRLIHCLFFHLPPPLLFLVLLGTSRKLQNGLKCADDHMRRCVSRNQRQVFEEVVKGTRDVITKLCIPGSTQMSMPFSPSPFLLINTVYDAVLMLLPFQLVTWTYPSSELILMRLKELIPCLSLYMHYTD